MKTQAFFYKAGVENTPSKIPNYTAITTRSQLHNMRGLSGYVELVLFPGWEQQLGFKTKEESEEAINVLHVNLITNQIPPRIIHMAKLSIFREG